MSPALGRFIQPDPIGFKGDASNLYRYCGNDWANRTDPTGMDRNDPADNQAGIVAQQKHQIAQLKAELNARLWSYGATALARAACSCSASSLYRAPAGTGIFTRSGATWSKNPPCALWITTSIVWAHRGLPLRAT